MHPPALREKTNFSLSFNTEVTGFSALILQLTKRLSRNQKRLKRMYFSHQGTEKFVCFQVFLFQIVRLNTMKWAFLTQKIKGSVCLAYHNVSVISSTVKQASGMIPMKVL